MEEANKRDDSLEAAHGSFADDILMSENGNDCINETVKTLTGDIGKPSASQSPTAKGDYSHKFSFHGDVTEPCSLLTSANMGEISDTKRDSEIWSTEAVYDNAADSSSEYIELQPDITNFDENLEYINQSTSKNVYNECSVILEKCEIDASEMQDVTEVTDSENPLAENLFDDKKYPLNKITQSEQIKSCNVNRLTDEYEVSKLNGAKICHEEILKDNELLMHINSLEVHALCNRDAGCLGMGSSSLNSFVNQNSSRDSTDNVALNETANNDAKSEYIQQWLETTPIGRDNLFNVHCLEKDKKHIDMDVTEMTSTKPNEFDFVKEFCESIDISKNEIGDHDFGLKPDNYLTEIQSSVSKLGALEILKKNDNDFFSDSMPEASVSYDKQEPNNLNEKLHHFCDRTFPEIHQNTDKSQICLSKCKRLALDDMVDNEAKHCFKKSDNSENSIILEEEAVKYDDLLFKNIVRVFKQLNNKNGSTLTEIMHLLKHKYPNEQKSKLLYNLQSFLNRGVDIGFLIRKRRRYLLLEMNAKKEDNSNSDMKERKHRSPERLPKSENNSRMQHLKNSKKRLTMQSRNSKRKTKFPQFKSRSLGKNLPKRKAALVARYRIRKGVIFNSI